MQKQPTFVSRDQLVQGKQYYLSGGTYQATFVGRDDDSIYFKCDQKNPFMKKTKGPFKGCISFWSHFDGSGFIEVDSEQ